MAVSLELLTDEGILDYTRGDNGRDRVIHDHHDIPLKDGAVRPFKGGI